MTIRSLILVQPARQFRVLVLLLIASFSAMLGTARANPMLLVDMDSLQVLYSQDAGHPWHPA